MQHYNASLQDEITELKTEAWKRQENGKYTNKLRMCITKLLSINVSINNVDSIVLRLMRSEDTKTHNDN